MSTDQTNFLQLRLLPARLTVEEVAWFLGMKPGDVAVLVAAKLLRPLGHPPTNGQKYFATCELERLGSDVDWLSKASDALVRHWRRRNAKNQSLEMA